ncbi:glycosyltransferase family 4 protein [Rhabdothermincola salaria]|uniref:glycosyltransferase family 4 protein n=1 Tax=Rhabdothermincola salaria TaxID=2903142 RepID=UPI001E4F732F|nr:glycosyltransferase family 4 protein [Rhabdothermincola salaria]MCD9623376.1 glycosyltransferase family 4 protein [Rhabdothermincola salaria]
MRLMFVVQRYGEDIAGGSEQCCRLFAEHMLQRGHHVEVATSCARRYTDWVNEFPAGPTDVNGVTVHRFPVDRPRDAHFSDINWVNVGTNRPVPLFLQEEWVDRMGPRTVDLPAYLVQRASDLDVIVFFTYHYFPTVRGLEAVAGKVCTVFHPTAHHEPGFTVPLYDRLFRLPDAIGYLTVEERGLVEESRGVQTLNDVLGVGVDLDVEGDGSTFRAAHGLGDEPYLVYVGRVDPGKGSLEAYQYFLTYKERNPGPLKLVVVGDQVVPLPPHPDVVLTGFLSEQAKTDALAGSLAFLQPSYFESFSMALTEAWALERAALVQGRCDVLVGQSRRSGGAIPYVGFAEFEAALDILLAEPAVAERLGQAGRRYVEQHYAWDVVMENYEALLTDARTAFERRRSSSWSVRIASGTPT